MVVGFAVFPTGLSHRADAAHRRGVLVYEPGCERQILFEAGDELPMVMVACADGEPGWVDVFEYLGLVDDIPTYEFRHTRPEDPRARRG